MPHDFDKITSIKDKIIIYEHTLLTLKSLHLTNLIKFSIDIINLGKVDSI